MKPTNDSALQFTLRELQVLCSSKKFWIGFLAVIIIISIAGPFGTSDQFGLGQRLIYWAVIAFLTFFCGLSVSFLTDIWLRDLGIPTQIARAIGATCAGLPIAGIVWFVNQVGFGLDMGGVSVFLRVWAYCTGISIAVMVLYFIVESAGSPKPTQNRFLERLPKHLGKNLRHISSQDHYVEAVTDRGSELILMRFSDAVDELAGFEGIQVHRAHWISFGAIKRPIRRDGRLFVEVVDGRQFPVSRSRSKAVKEALNI